jgi:hypothetical protein
MGMISVLDSLTTSRLDFFMRASPKISFELSPVDETQSLQVLIYFKQQQQQQQQS